MARLVPVLSLLALLGTSCARPEVASRPRFDASPVTLVPPRPTGAPAPLPPPLGHEDRMRALLAPVTDPIRIRLFIRTPDGDPLSAALEEVCRRVLAVASVPGRIDVQDPLESVELTEEARLLGVHPLGSPPTRRLADALPADGYYRAMVVAIGSRFMVVSQVTTDRGSAELQVAEALSRFLHGPRLVGLVASPERERHLTKLRRVLDRLDVRPIGAEGPFSEELSAILVVGPGAPLSAEASAAISSFLRRGRAVAFLLDGMEVVPQTGQYAVRPARSGLDALLAEHGVRVARDLVLDRRCSRVSVPARVGRMLLDYPPIPLATVTEQAVTSEVARVELPFPSSLSVRPPAGMTATELMTSSPESWVLTRGFNLTPHQTWSPEGPSGPFLLGAVMHRTEEAQSGPRIAVVGNARFVEDRHLERADNARFVRGLVEWLSGHRELTRMIYEDGQR